jgi:hypothetical protein
MANVTLGMCMQLKGCNSEVFYHHGPVTGGSADDGKLQMVWWTLAEWLSTPAQCAFGGLMMQGTLRDGAVHWIWDDVCCIFFCLRWTNGVESPWKASTICLTTCDMADGTKVSSIGEPESLGCMVDLEEGDSVFA